MIHVIELYYKWDKCNHASVFTSKEMLIIAWEKSFKAYIFAYFMAKCLPVIGQLVICPNGNNVKVVWYPAQGSQCFFALAYTLMGNRGSLKLMGGIYVSKGEDNLTPTPVLTTPRTML